jgi:hypothetical protein
MHFLRLEIIRQHLTEFFAKSGKKYQLEMLLQLYQAFDGLVAQIYLICGGQIFIFYLGQLDYF